ncbi:MAG: NADH-quinone oxidoreductase subunit C [Candidatus Margulisiibacteriota bacterium]|jgi:ech hydrogenase subunit D
MKFEVIEIKDLIDKAKVLFFDKCRLVQICATKSQNFEILYTFEKDNELINFKLIFPDTEMPVPSISAIYAIAFLYENELKDLFGFQFTGLSLDYKGCFYQTKIKNPFAVNENDKIKNDLASTISEGAKNG